MVHIFELVRTWVLLHGIVIVIVVGVALVINKTSHIVIERIVRRLVSLNRSITSTEAERKREDTLIRIVHGSVRVLVWMVTVLIVLSEMGVDITPLIAAAGIMGLAFGFGGQYLIKDLISGFFIILENQYRIGDVVCFDTVCGLVEDITLRATILRDLDGTVHHVPHGSIERVSNLSKQFARVNLNIGVAYSSDLEQVISVINETGILLADDSEWKEKILKPVKFERVDEFADSALIVKVLGETLPLKQWEVAGEFRKRIKIAFDTAGIIIPYPQTTIHIQKESSH